MADTAVRPAPAAPIAAEPRVDAARLTPVLLGTWADIRLEAREMIKDPVFWRVDGEHYLEHRERVLEQCRLLAQRGASSRALPEEYGGRNTQGGNLAGFEELVLADPSLQIKSGVQWGLFTSAIFQLGTKPHFDRWLRDASSLDLPGAFAMTEIGHGSDVQALGTTATYDVETQEFVIETPFRAATKDYLGNAAKHARAATVFAQLITGGVNYGVHCFFVPIRDADGNDLPGITSEDDGPKGGLNGIDNGRLAFDRVRIPRENLLNRYGDVAADGTYSSPIASPGRRFFTMLGALVQGRVSLDGAATWASALALKIAVTYGNERRQFAGPAGEETVLLDYAKHRRRLIPRIATAYAQTFAHEELLQKFDGVFSGATDTDENRQDLETLAAALKPLSTWNALSTIQEAREACGGQGFLAENRLVGLHQDLDVYATFEGDNNVLLQLVGKRLLGDLGAQLKGKDARELAAYVARQSASKLFHGAGLRQLGQTVADLGSTARSVEFGLRAEDQHHLLTDRVQQMVADVGGRLNAARRSGAAAQQAAFDENQVELLEAARAHGELLQWEAFSDGLERIEDEGTRTVLTWVRDLFGLSLIEQHLSWHLIHGRLSTQRASAVTRYIDRLCTRLRPHAQDLVDAFGFAPEHVRAPIASGAEATRQDEARAYYADLAARGAAPTPEKRPTR
ncbi:acyl-CoA dehydrogenase [Microbacterium sp. ZXX196]|uniref:acyl-CoA dehydrogenase family protein n=1 Tax=Microbacterium sp. ZXX196 TaxID=2609291 RepID=UPI001328356B|nr:acyl-CoA dehydrogenase [Microbacterium sp. ZXX196]